MKKRMFNLFIALVMAFSFVGVMPEIDMKVEAAGTADSIISVASNEIGNGLSKYTKEMGMINNSYTYAWCAAFVSWCGAHSGSSDVISKTASCYNQYYNSSGARHWVVNDKSYKPVKGDLIYFDWNATGAKNSNFDHVGIVVSYNASTNKITTIEGNYGNSGSANNKVVKTTRDYNNKVKCFLTPKYSNPVPPTNTKVSIDKYYYYVGENVTFNLSSNGGTAYTIGIDAENSTRTRIDTKETKEKSYTRTFSKPGKYSCYITSYNEAGLNDSSRIYFEVYNSKPTNATVSLDKYYYYAGESVVFHFSSVLGFSYTIGIDEENGTRTRIDTKDTKENNYKRIFSKPGKYSCYITTYNVYGLADSKRIYFEIYNSKPSFAKVSLDKNYFDIGENVLFHLSSGEGLCYTVGIDDANGNRIDTQEIKGKSYSRTFSKSGKYSCYVTTYNNYGLTDSQRIYFEVGSHTWGNWTTSKNATCTADGQKIRKCSVCGKTETSAIAKTGHKYESKVIAPTCTAKGYTLYTCSICKNSYKDKYTNEIAHKWTDWTTSKNATCTADGQKIRKCSVCGKTETSAIAKTGHKYESKVIAPTCTAKGYTLYTCSICKNSYKDKYINAKGHSFECKDENGSKIYTCSGCQFNYSVTFKGEGTEASPYLITSKQDLLCLSELMQNETTAYLFRNKRYLQTNDIDLQNMDWTPLGVFYVNDNATGMYFEEGFVYNGGNHNIFNLNVNGGRVFAGLFGKVNNGTIKNLSVYGNVKNEYNHYPSHYRATGGIVGELGYTGKVINCSFIGDVVSNDCSGGIVGKMWRGGTIENCYCIGNIEGKEHSGGIAAFMNQGDQEYIINYSIKNCYFAGSVKNENAGAICGGWLSEGKSSGNDTEKIENCYYLKSSAEKGLGSGSITKDDSTALISPMLKQISEDLGSSFAEKTYDSVNKGYPVFTWQTPSKVKGDIDNNGNVNVSDAVTVQKCLTGKCMVTDGQYVTADMNDDGMVNIFDMILIRRTLGIK